MTYRVQIRLGTGESDGEEVPAGGDAAHVQGLRDVHGEVSDELDGVGAGLVLAVPDLASLGLGDAALQDLGLVRERADDAALEAVVTVRVHVAVGGRVVGRVDVVPRLRVRALGRLPVPVRPGADAAQTTLVLGLQQPREDGPGKRGQKLLGCVGDLLVYCSMLGVSCKFTLCLGCKRCFTIRVPSKNRGGKEAGNGSKLGDAHCESSYMISRLKLIKSRQYQMRNSRPI
jgi:hypothetical protein